LSRLTQIAQPHTRFVFLGAGFRLGLPPHPASRRRSCLRLGVSTTSSSRGLSPPIDRPCRAYSRAPSAPLRGRFAPPDPAARSQEPAAIRARGHGEARPQTVNAATAEPLAVTAAMQVSGQRPGRTSGPPQRVPPRLRRLSGTVGGCIWPREDHCDCRPGPRMARRIHRAACPFLVGPGSRGGVAELLSPLGALRRSALRRRRGWSPWSAMQRSRPGAPERIRLPPRRITLPAVTCRGPAADLPWTCGGPGMYLAIGH